MTNPYDALRGELYDVTDQITDNYSASMSNLALRIHDTINRSEHHAEAGDAARASALLDMASGYVIELRAMMDVSKGKPPVNLL